MVKFWSPLDPYETLMNEMQVMQGCLGIGIDTSWHQGDISDHGAHRQKDHQLAKIAFSLKPYLNLSLPNGKGFLES